MTFVVFVFIDLGFKMWDKFTANTNHFVTAFLKYIGILWESGIKRKPKLFIFGYVWN